MAHLELKDQLEAENLEAKYPKKILINALNQVLKSVNRFIKQGGSKKAYLEFVVGYFK